MEVRNVLCSGSWDFIRIMRLDQSTTCFPLLTLDFAISLLANDSNLTLLWTSGEFRLAGAHSQVNEKRVGHVYIRLSRIPMADGCQKFLTNRTIV